MKLSYLNHSAYLMDLDHTAILVDYGSLPARPRQGRLEDGVFALSDWTDKGKNLVGYSSHRHRDHFDPALCKAFLKAGLTYILSDEVDLAFEGYMDDPNFHRLLPQTEAQIEGLHLANSGSTDQGGSLLFQEEGADFSTYFGADLAIWDDFPEFYRGFDREKEWLASRKSKFSPVKLAFFPAGTSDGYQEDPLLDGAGDLIQLFQPSFVIPIHGYGYPDYYPDFARRIQERLRGWDLEIASFKDFSKGQKEGKTMADLTILYPEKPGDSVDIQDVSTI